MSKVLVDRELLEREAFEAEFPPPVGVTFHAQLKRYCVGFSGTLMERDVYQAAWEGWQARATRPAQTAPQPGQSGLSPELLRRVLAALDQGATAFKAVKEVRKEFRAALSTQGAGDADS